VTNVVVRVVRGESAVAAGTYLMTVPLIVLFSGRLLLGKADPGT
jgi:hypothetical protein